MMNQSLIPSVVDTFYLSSLPNYTIIHFTHLTKAQTDILLLEGAWPYSIVNGVITFDKNVTTEYVVPVSVVPNCQPSFYMNHRMTGVTYKHSSPSPVVVQQAPVSPPKKGNTVRISHLFTDLMKVKKGEVFEVDNNCAKPKSNAKPVDAFLYFYRKYGTANATLTNQGSDLQVDIRSQILPGWIIDFIDKSPRLELNGTTLRLTNATPDELKVAEIINTL